MNTETLAATAKDQTQNIREKFHRGEKKNTIQLQVKFCISEKLEYLSTGHTNPLSVLSKDEYFLSNTWLPLLFPDMTYLSSDHDDLWDRIIFLYLQENQAHSYAHDR